MKIAIQVTTNNLGDIVVEEIEERSTTNPEDQKAILVELLVKALYKITASYRVPKEMLDLGDEEYVDANTRHREQQKEPRPSTADRNRQLRESISEPNVQSIDPCGNCILDECCGSKEHTDIKNEDVNYDSEDNLIINDYEIPAVEEFLRILRNNQMLGQ